MFNNMSDEAKVITVAGLSIVLILLTLILTTFVFNIVAVRSGLHQQEDVHRDCGFIWVK